MTNKITEKPLTAKNMCWRKEVSPHLRRFRSYNQSVLLNDAQAAVFWRVMGASHDTHAQRQSISAYISGRTSGPAETQTDHRALIPASALFCVLPAGSTRAHHKRRFRPLCETFQTGQQMAIFWLFVKPAPCVVSPDAFWPESVLSGFFVGAENQFDLICTGRCRYRTACHYMQKAGKC